MHDGVAQEIASLGYLVDALAATPASDEQAARFLMLRERVSEVVAEVRRSVVTLRTTVGESESLGAAIGSLARNLSELSGVADRGDARREVAAAARRGRGRAVPDHPGGAQQRRQARPVHTRSGCTATSTPRGQHLRDRQRPRSGRPRPAARCAGRLLRPGHHARARRAWSGPHLDIEETALVAGCGSPSRYRPGTRRPPTGRTIESPERSRCPHERVADEGDAGRRPPADPRTVSAASSRCTPT